MSERLLKRALELRTCAPEANRLGAAVAHGDLSPDDVRWVYLAAKLVEAVIEDLEPGTLRSPDDLPEQPPLFTTRQLFKALEARVKRLEDAADGETQSGRWPRDQRMPVCVAGAEYGEWYHQQCLEEYWAERGRPIIQPRTAADMNHYVFWWNERAATISSGGVRTEGGAARPEVETVTSEPNAALYMTCPSGHPLACRTTATRIEDGPVRGLRYEVVCPKCEADGTIGLIALGGADA